MKGVTSQKEKAPVIQGLERLRVPGRKAPLQMQPGQDYQSCGAATAGGKPGAAQDQPSFSAIFSDFSADQASFNAWNRLGAVNFPTGRCTVEPPLLKRSLARYVPSVDAVTSMETVTASPDLVSIRRCSAPPAARFCSRAAVPFRELAESVLMAELCFMLLGPPDGCRSRLSFNDSITGNRGGTHSVRAIVRNSEADRTYFRIVRMKAGCEGLKYFNVLQSLRCWIWIVSWRRNGGRHHVNARWWQSVMTQRSNAGAVFAGHFGARSSNSATNHVPNQQPIDTLIPRNDFGAQAGVYA